MNNLRGAVRTRRSYRVRRENNVDIALSEAAKAADLESADELAELADLYNRQGKRYEAKSLYTRSNEL